MSSQVPEVQEERGLLTQVMEQGAQPAGTCHLGVRLCPVSWAEEGASASRPCRLHTAQYWVCHPHLTEDTRWQDCDWHSPMVPGGTWAQTSALLPETQRRSPPRREPGLAGLVRLVPLL